MSNTVVIVEDEVKIAQVLREYLELDGFLTTVLHSGATAVETILALRPALVLLDVMLPGVDGLSICKQVRAQASIPIIMLTARVEEIDRLLGLELGADDYVCKPFSPREVVARVKAVLRRAYLTEGVALSAIVLRLRPEQFRAWVCDREVSLTAVEFRLLHALAKPPVRALSRAHLQSALYLDHRVVSDRTVDSHVKNLRRKLVEAGGGDEWLRAIYGVGYRLDVPCQIGDR